jgi:quinol monooxygenase YgiN
MMKVIIASFKVFPQYEKEIVTEMKILLQETKHEPGNQVYSIQQAHDNPLHWIVYEVYKNQDAIDTHMKSSYVQSFLKKIPGMVSEPPRIELLELHESTGF